MRIAPRSYALLARAATLAACAAALVAAPSLASAQGAAPTDSGKGGKGKETSKAVAPPDRVTNVTNVSGSASVLGANVGTGARQSLVTEDYSVPTEVAGTADAAWEAVKGAYAQFKLPFNNLSDASRTIALRNVRLRDKMGGERLSKSVTCGVSADGREAADSYEVILDVVTVVLPSGDGARVVTSIAGDARPVFTSGDPVRCISTGRLEGRIAKAVKDKVGG